MKTPSISFYQGENEQINESQIFLLFFGKDVAKIQHAAFAATRTFHGFQGVVLKLWRVEPRSF
jgi:hypothetical protein